MGKNKKRKLHEVVLLGEALLRLDNLKRCSTPIRIYSRHTTGDYIQFDKNSFTYLVEHIIRVVSQCKNWIIDYDPDTLFDIAKSLHEGDVDGAKKLANTFMKALEEREGK